MVWWWWNFAASTKMGSEKKVCVQCEHTYRIKKKINHPFIRLWNIISCKKKKKRVVMNLREMNPFNGKKAFVIRDMILWNV